MKREKILQLILPLQVLLREPAKLLKGSGELLEKR